MLKEANQGFGELLTKGGVRGFATKLVAYRGELIRPRLNINFHHVDLKFNSRRQISKCTRNIKCELVGWLVGWEGGKVKKKTKVISRVDLPYIISNPASTI